MKKIISIFLVLVICLTVGVYAEEREILESENLNNNAEILEPLESEPLDTEMLDIDKISELQADENVVLYAASSVVASGECGENLTWTVDSGGTLTVSGSGELYEYRSSNEVPWNEYKEDIRYINLDIFDSSICANGYCYAFYMLNNVKEISIPEGITVIQESEYVLPYTLSKLILPSTYTGNLSRNNLICHKNQLDIEVAADNPVYSSVDGTLFNKDQTKLIQYTHSYEERNYVVPETVKDIDGAFYCNSNLETLTISKNVEIIDKDTYNNNFDGNGIGCDLFISPCRAVYVDEENPYFCSVDGVLYNKDMTMLVWYPPQKTGNSYTVPDSVKVIAAGAFKNSKVSNVQLPDGIEVLGRYAFSISQLQSITLPESITAIYVCCFFCCYKLSKVYIKSDETAEYSLQVFDGCTNLKTAGPIESGCDIEFGWKTAIPENAFLHYTNLTEITMPDTILSIEQYAFGYNSNLKKINIPDNVREIGQSAFLGCTSLSEITIPHSVTCIDDYAFEKCTALTNMYIDKAEGTLAGTRWAAPNATITYLREIHVEPIPKSHIYTGYAIAPVVSISERRKDGTVSTALAEYEDYTLTYYDNINAGTANVEIDFQNGYSELKNKNLTFAITPKASDGLIITPIPNQAYTSHAIMPNPQITDTKR